MKPLIFEFAEQATGPELDFSTVEYDTTLNLNIDKRTGKPAIDALTASTATRTKSHDEASDSDKEDFNIMMETETRTFSRMEVSDSDANRLFMNESVITMTTTRQMIEGSDSDV
jgi:hypothetical protein